MAKKYTDKGLPDRWDDPAVRSGAVHSFAPMYYTEHADDPDGRWYKGTCDVSYAVDRQAASETVLKFLDHDIAWVWVPAGQPAPEPYIDARTLVSAAMDSVTIPAPQIDTNPKITTGDGITNATVVGMDTWIWATGDTPSQVTVTATAGSPQSRPKPQAYASTPRTAPPHAPAGAPPGQRAQPKGLPTAQSSSPAPPPTSAEPHP